MFSPKNLEVSILLADIRHKKPYARRIYLRCCPLFCLQIGGRSCLEHEWIRMDLTMEMLHWWNGKFPTTIFLKSFYILASKSFYRWKWSSELRIRRLFKRIKKSTYDCIWLLTQKYFVKFNYWWHKLTSKLLITGTFCKLDFKIYQQLSDAFVYCESRVDDAIAFKIVDKINRNCGVLGIWVKFGTVNVDDADCDSYRNEYNKKQF